MLSRVIFAVLLLAVILLHLPITTAKKSRLATASSKKTHQLLSNAVTVEEYSATERIDAEAERDRRFVDAQHEHCSYPISCRAEKSVLLSRTVPTRIGRSPSFHKKRDSNPHSATVTRKRLQQSVSCETKSIIDSGNEGEIIAAELFTEQPEEKSIFRTYNEQHEPVLTYYGLMLAGAVARSVSAAAVHPLNVIKTLLQTREGKMPAMQWAVLSRGAGSQLFMSVPHGAMSFVVTEKTKAYMSKLTTNTTLSRAVPSKVLNPVMDFLSSSISTFICSSVSTPQMVVTDRIMAGVYPNFFAAVVKIFRTEGIMGFYQGWFPALVQKIPSYALTWMFFQQLKQLFYVLMERAGTTFENTMLGSLAAAGACSVMIPVDTVKTRLVTQRPGTAKYYTGMADCFSKILDEEGVGSLYKSLPPRLFSVTPMIGIQFGVYELMKRLLVGQPPPRLAKKKAVQ